MKYTALLFTSIFYLGCSYSTPVNNEVSVEQETSSGAEVAFLWMFHFESRNNLLTQDFDDVFSEKSQQEILDLVDKLKAYKPTKIAVERPYYTHKELNAKYHQYLAGDYTLTSEETDQIAFRLGKELGLDSLFVVYYAGNYDMDPVKSYAEKHNQMHHYKQTMSLGMKLVNELNASIEKGGIPGGLKYMNSDSTEMLNHLTYYPLMQIASDSNCVGLNLVADWYKTNLGIYSNIKNIITPEDRVLVLYGQGHSAILSKLIKDDPELELVDISAYLE